MGKDVKDSPKYGSWGSRVQGEEQKNHELTGEIENTGIYHQNKINTLEKRDPEIQTEMGRWERINVQLVKTNQ